MRPPATIRVLAALLLFAIGGSAATYTVRPGDTLSGIARRFGVGVDDLADANGIRDANRIGAGQVLQIPGKPAAEAATAPAARSYTVKSGDTLAAIAQRHGTTVTDLAARNGIANPNRIAAGTQLAIGPAWVCPVGVAVRFADDFGAPRGGGRAHEGIDLVAATGAPVVANVAGTLVHATNPLGGNAYELRGDDGAEYYGAHLDRLVAAPGRVALGQLIGTVGTTGNAVGGVPHLHFERHPGGGPAQNPMPFLLRACLRS